MEDERIDEIVIDAPIDDVDPLRPARRAHEDDVLVDEKIPALDQLDAQLVGQEGVFVVGGVEGAGGQQHNHRFGIADARRHRAQARQQRVRIVLNGRDAVLGEQIRHQPHRHFAVFQHVGNARRRARIVLQHVERVAVDANDVDAGDMHPDVVRRAAADHLRPVVGIAKDEFRRDDPFLEDRPRPVNVGQEKVQRAHALGEAGLQPPPFGAGENAGNDVEGDQPLGGVLVAVDAEGDADAAEHVLRLGAARGEHIGRRLLEPFFDMPVERAHVLLFETHFIEEAQRRHS